MFLFVYDQPSKNDDLPKNVYKFCYFCCFPCLLHVYADLNYFVYKQIIKIKSTKFGAKFIFLYF